MNNDEKLDIQVSRKRFALSWKKTHTIFSNNSGNSFSITCFRDAAKTEGCVPKCHNREGGKIM